MYKATSGFSHAVSAVHAPPFAATTRSASPDGPGPETISDVALEHGRHRVLRVLGRERDFPKERPGVGGHADQHASR